MKANTYHIPLVKTHMLKTIGNIFHVRYGFVQLHILANCRNTYWIALCISPRMIYKYCILSCAFRMPLLISANSASWVYLNRISAEIISSRLVIDVVMCVNSDSYTVTSSPSILFCFGVTFSFPMSS